MSPACIRADAATLSSACESAAALRRSGTPFFAAPLIDDRRTVAALASAARVLRTERDFDCRYDLLAKLSAAPLGDPRFSVDAAAPDAALLKALIDAADALLVRSWTEFARIAGILGDRPPLARRALYERAAAPRWTARFGGKHLVVWAPRSEPDEVALAAFGLEDLHTATYVVCRDPERGAELGLRATFVGEERALPILEDALAIVVADISDPAPAVALAEAGVPLAIASTSGAHEYVDGAPIFLPWNARSVRSAALVALGSAPPRLRRYALADADLSVELMEPAVCR